MRFVDLVVFEYVHEGMHCWYFKLSSSELHAKPSATNIRYIWNCKNLKMLDIFTNILFRSKVTREDWLLCDCVSVDA